MAACCQLPWLQLELALYAIKDWAATWVNLPEEVVPIGIHVSDQPERIEQALLDVVIDQYRHLEGEVEFYAPTSGLHTECVLSSWDCGLRGSDHLKQRTFVASEGASTDDNCPGTIPKQCMTNDVAPIWG